ncbi:MAG: C39 family peptidase [Anaerolineaceae bacterium]|nr:C39 family peptidase [Anaerolineaceae bacterium]
MFTKKILPILLAIVLLGIILMLIPPIRESVLWRLDALQTRIYYKLNPPDEVELFVPEEEAAELPAIETPTPLITMTAMSDVEAEGQEITPKVEASATPTLTPTPLPESFILEDVVYQDQHDYWNYCAPANLYMGLRYWDWEGDIVELGTAIKPFPEDFNVMLYEMVNYVNEETPLRALQRSGGTLELAKRLIVSGFPVLIEKGVYIRDISGRVSWMGHYSFITAYDDAISEFTTQDSYYEADYKMTYEDLQKEWRSFNYMFMVVYPPEREAELMQVLGEYADEQAAYQIAYNIATAEINQLEGEGQFFAWYNRGTSLKDLQDYFGAASAYDQAFLAYSALPENERPYRVTWYETGPYFAYYYAGRYQDIIELATNTLDTARKPYLEESFVWRARASIALGDRESAVADLCESLQYHPDFGPSLNELAQLGLSADSCP